MPPIRLKQFVRKGRIRIQLNIPSRRALIRAGIKPVYVVGGTLCRLYPVQLPEFDIILVPPAHSTNPIARSLLPRIKPVTSAENMSDYRYKTVHTESGSPKITWVMLPPTKAMRENKCDICLDQHSSTNGICKDGGDSAVHCSDTFIFELNGSKTRNSFKCDINVIGGNVGVDRSLVELTIHAR